MVDVNSNLNFTIHTEVDDLFKVVLPLYAEVYAESPYNEGPVEIDDFIERWNSQIRTPGFRLVLAHLDRSIAGFSFGFPLAADTNWWNGQLDPVNKEITQEYPGRTFAIIELAVSAQYRRRGIGHNLHATLLQQRPEQRVTLLSRADAIPAQAAYSTWGYQTVGRVQPGNDAPIYIAMIRALPLDA